MLKHVRATESWHEKNIGQKGFTLIELLVVIIILGILAGIVVVSISRFQTTGDVNACRTEKKSVEAAAAAFFAESTTTPKSWPSSMSDLTGGTDPYLKAAPKFNWSLSGGNVTSGSGNPSGC